MGVEDGPGAGEGTRSPGAVERPLAVVMPVFNEAEVIEALILDLERELVPAVQGVQVVVVDDASTDETPAILGRLATDRPWLRVERPARNAGHGPSVVRGLGLGRKLGFPTANVNLKRLQAPVDGIFAARVSGLGPKLLDGVASVGTRPTVGGGKALLEVLIFDFDRDIYGEYITVHFIERLREERHFGDLPALQRQMHLDVAAARAALRA